MMKDNFSRQSDLYARFRPTYPAELFDFILSHIENRNAVWDCGTGNGQAAKELAKYYGKVFATDISQKQIEKAEQAKNIFYSIQPAEKTDFADNSFDLITVSQALHWFDFSKFYPEVKRVAKPGAWISVWMYYLCHITPEIDEIVNVKYYKKILGNYWDDERKLVDEKYSTVPFPFGEIKCPMFETQFDWTLDQLEGYLNSWSSLQKFILKNKFNPVDDLMKQIRPFWAQEKMKIVFPIHMRMGKIEK